jgi:integration host factor subunit beta
MNKADVVRSLAKILGVSYKKAHDVVNTVFHEIEGSLISGQRVEIRGFGSFRIKEYKGYTGRNPKTGAAIEVAPKRLPVFKVGKDLKERVDII